MLPRFQHIALIGKYNAPGMRHVLEDTARFLLAQGRTVSLEADTAQNTGITGFPALTPDELGATCDLAIVVGGDGTMLAIARQLARYNIPLVGINQGRLGFITDIPVNELTEALTQLLAGEFVEDRRTMLEGQVQRDGETIFEGLAMNDVVVSRGGTASMVELKVDIGAEFVANFRADGLIVGSPTGSTAYALSAGGPLMHPAVAAWILAPIAPHDLSNRPIVLPDVGEVRMEIIAGRDASVNFDMQSLTSLHHGDTICVRRSIHQVRFLHPRNWSYYATLRRKLYWNAGGQR